MSKDKSLTREVATRARRDVGTLRLNRRGSPKGSRQVLADVAGHLEHVDARHREDRLQGGIRLNRAAVVELVLLDVGPDLLGNLSARHLLPTADGRQRRRKDL